MDSLIAERSWTWHAPTKLGPFLECPTREKSRLRVCADMTIAAAFHHLASTSDTRATLRAVGWNGKEFDFAENRSGHFITLSSSNLVGLRGYLRVSYICLIILLEQISESFFR